MESKHEKVLHGTERLSQKFVGQHVRVFLMNGAVLSGKMVEASEKDARIVDERRNKEATVTFDHVVSITRY